jgi:putative phosphoribosyl transferase
VTEGGGHELTEVQLAVDGGTITGDLGIPRGASGVVAFAHGSGSSRHSRRTSRSRTRCGRRGSPRCSSTCSPRRRRRSTTAPGSTAAVVSRGGRPDLAGDALGDVACPTLLLVGGDDEPVIRMNEEALARLRVPAELVVVSGATHLFEEPGTLEEVAALARGHFVVHLRG